MKMLMAIVQPKDASKVQAALAKAKIGATKLQSTGASCGKAIPPL